MRVDDRNALDGGIQQPGRSLESQRVDVVSLSRATGPNASASVDRLQLSSLTDRISQTMDSMTVAESRRAEQLHAAFQSGRYTVDSETLSKALVNEMMSGAGGF